MKKNLLYIVPLSVVLMGMSAACTDDIVNDADKEGLPGKEQREIVQLVVGNERPEITRAIDTIAMPNKVRFSAMMLIKQSDSDSDPYKFETPFYANMVVDDKYTGNSLYYKADYSIPAVKDSYDNDDEASIFYWQNRLHHGFIGYIDDYNAALRCAQGGDSYSPKSLSAWKNDSPADDEGKKDPNLAEDINILYNMKKDGTILSWQQYEKFDLRNPKDADGKLQNIAMNDQKDPLIAYKEVVPEGSSAEKNRVYLTFRHQLSQVQVNLRGSGGSNDVTSASQIDSVYLLGVSEEAYVFPYPEYGVTEEGNPKKIIRQGESGKELLRQAYAVPVTLAQITANPPSGTEFSMGPMADGTQATGYLKGFESIAFGNLDNLRIVWHEVGENGDAGVSHRVTFKITKDEFKTLKSGKRYVFNLELRRGTLAVVKAVIDDWIPYPTNEEDVYHTTGTIQK